MICLNNNKLNELSITNKLNIITGEYMKKYMGLCNSLSKGKNLYKILKNNIENIMNDNIKNILMISGDDFMHICSTGLTIKQYNNEVSFDL